MIGAGLAGLTAAATASRSGKRVTVVEAHAGGGRARTDERNGYRFNQGPHALYRGGEGWRILRRLGVAHRGHLPSLRGARGSRDDALVRLTGASMTKLIAGLARSSPASWAGRNAQEWVESLGGGTDVADLARMVIRVSTYVADLEVMPADLALSQARTAFRGVSYLDGGWSTLAEGLRSAACTAGATLRTHQAAAGVSQAPGGWEVALAGGEVLQAPAVVIAPGSPAAALRLLPVDPGWRDPGRPVTAACLDLGLRDYQPRPVFGLDQPLYLSRHCPPGDLAPAGGSVVHVMRYGARGAVADRADLLRHARLAGILDDNIVEERFLACMVVTHLLPTPDEGLAGRPPVAVREAEGIFVAGDWVGPTGWLADAAMASGECAGRLATRSPAPARTYPRVA
ncbi:FAD-dependent oxidoreductase [Acidiferrimicrobium sp. IK]|uniref:FAD-dependent oxidoreductase n=1 Tax=Acidiferrimicrobium sp. IK TaxID=2871700 RepID=UPI0021CB1719|nr:FAD-dependent oxidoreductase [Acidiferrimicrobium sp. IK]MCU4184597.1 FAD-dependent oxidoreductase [Acidiferrimicrobium sp. IK]